MRETGEILRNNKCMYVYKTVSLGKCQIKTYFERNICKRKEFGGILAAQQSRANNLTHFNSQAINELKTANEKVYFESRQKARENAKFENKNGGHDFETKDDEENLREFNKLCRKDLGSRFIFPNEDVCPYLSIRGNVQEKMAGKATYCTTSQLNQSECEFVNKFLGKPRGMPARVCPRRKTTRSICWFGKLARNDIQDTAELQCDARICRDNAVYLGVFNSTLGQVIPDVNWPKLVNHSALVDAVADIIRKDYSTHFR